VISSDTRSDPATPARFEKKKNMLANVRPGRQFHSMDRDGLPLRKRATPVSRVDSAVSCAALRRVARISQSVHLSGLAVCSSAYSVAVPIGRPEGAVHLGNRMALTGSGAVVRKAQ
jgi:hypothetical protein